MANVFISHSAANEPLVQKLSSALASRGFSVRADTEIPPGVDWKDAIEDSLRKADAVIFFLVPSQEASPWLQYEWRMALNSAVFYATHKCNLDCSYCTQKNPEVFSEELDTEKTVRVLHAIRRGVDTILFTGGEPLIRPDIVELVRVARREARFLDVLLVTNGVLLEQQRGILDHLTGLIVSLDAITPNPARDLSKASVVTKVLANLEMVRKALPPRAITISCVLEEWNIGEAERILEYCTEQGHVFAVQSAQNGLYPNFTLLQSARYRAFVEKLIRLRAERKAPINGSPKLLRTLLEFGDFRCYPTMFPRVYPNGDVFYPCEPLRKVAGNLLEDGSFSKIFERGRKLYGEIPECKSICYLFGNVLSSYYVEDFWGLPGEYIRR